MFLRQNMTIKSTHVVFKIKWFALFCSSNFVSNNNVVYQPLVNIVWQFRLQETEDYGDVCDVE